RALNSKACAERSARGPGYHTPPRLANRCRSLNLRPLACVDMPSCRGLESAYVSACWRMFQQTHTRPASLWPLRGAAVAAVGETRITYGGTALPASGERLPALQLRPAQWPPDPGAADARSGVHLDLFLCAHRRPRRARPRALRRLALPG